jgi:membrane protein
VSTHIQSWVGLLKQALREWGNDNGPRLSAALAFYALFSLAPLSVILVTVAGSIYGAEGGREALIMPVRRLVGYAGATALEGILSQTALDPASSRLATALSVVTVIVGTTRLFQHLKGSLNYIWDVASFQGSSVRGIVWRQFLLFLVVMGIGFLLLASLGVSAGLASLSLLINGYVPASAPLWWIVNAISSFAIITLLVAVIYRVLPDVEIAWHDVWAGAIFTSALFVVGQYILAAYLTRVSIGSAYGAAGSVIILLIWVYFSAQVFLFGAEFTQAYANAAGRAILPDERAVRLIRQTFTEHQHTIDKIEDEWEARLEQIRVEAEALKARAAAGGVDAPPPSHLSRLARVGAPLATFAIGLVLGVLGIKTRRP